MANWNEYTVLSHFRQLRAGQFDPLRQEFGIELSDEQLTGCAIHCALVLRRDPTVGELFLWDRLAKMPFPVTKATVTALETESAALAETFADMMAKRRELSFNTPITLFEAFTLATDALARGGKEAALKALDLRLADRMSAPFAACGIAGKNAAAFLSIFKKDLSFSSSGAGDLCLLLEKGNLSQYGFWQALLPVLESNDWHGGIRALFPVTTCGILPALLSRSDGLTIDLSRFSKSDLPMQELLAGEYPEDWILTVSEPVAETIAATLRTNGIPTTIFAQLTSGKQVKLVGHGNLTENTDFLRSLAPAPSGLALTLQADDTLTAPVTLGVQIGYPCAYLSADRSFAQSAAAMGLSVSSATAEIKKGAFSTAVLTALSSILSCALAGVDYPEMRLAVNVALPNGAPTDAANTFAAAIGLYRVQAELGIPALQTRFAVQAIATPALSVFALGKGVGTPAANLSGKDSKLYLIPISLSSEGLPDFAELRILLSDLAAQAKHGVIRSARVVLQTSPKAAFAEMKSETLTARINRTAKGWKEPLTLGILLESVYEMPFDCVGTIAERDHAPKPVEIPAETPDPFLIPQGNGLIWRAAPEVVILAPENEPDALALSRFLGERGAAVKVFTPAEKDPFLRAVLTASVVYRFPDTRLGRDAKTVFALSVLGQNGGEVRCLKKVRQKKRK